MKDNLEVCSDFIRNPLVSYRACCPNMIWLKSALKANVKELNFFSSPSETFHKKNINCSIVTFLTFYIYL